MNRNSSRSLWLLLAALASACSETGIERQPVPSPMPSPSPVPSPMPPGVPPQSPRLIDLWAQPDPTSAASSGFCGTIGSSGIRDIEPLGGDGSFAVAYGSGRIVLHIIGRPAAVRTLVAHAAPIRDLSVSLDGKRMISAAEDGEVKLWQVSDGQLERVVAEKSVFTPAIISPDGSLVALNRDSVLEVQQATGGAALWRAKDVYEHPVAFSADGQTLVSSLNDMSFRRARDGQVLRTLENTRELSSTSVVSPDLARVLMYARGDRLGMLDVATNTVLWTVPASIDFKATFSRDGSQLAITSRIGGLKVIRLADGVILREWPVTDGDSSAVAFAADGSQVALGLVQGGFRVWDIESSELLVKEIAQPGHMEAVDELAFSPDGTLLGSMRGSFAQDRRLRVWRTSDAALLYTTDLRNSDYRERAFAFTPDSSTVAVTTGLTRRLHLLDARDGSSRRILEDIGAGSLTFSPDGAYVVGSNLFEGGSETLGVWRVVDGRPEPGFGASSPLPGHGVTFSPDGSLIAATNDGLGGGDLVAVWRVADRKLLWSQPAEIGVAARAAFSPDGMQLAVSNKDPGTMPGGKPDVVRIHRSEDGRVLRELVVSGVRAVAFSPTGELATAGDAGLRLWRVADGQPFAEATGSFTAVAVAADNQRLAVAGSDGSLSLLCRFGQISP